MRSQREDIIKRRRLRHFVPLLAAVILLAACSSKLQPPVNIPDGGGTLHIKIDDYRFEPNNIHVRSGDPVVVEVEDVSGREHTFSLYDPMKRLLRSVVVPAGQTVTLWGSGRPFEPGEYWFYCNRAFHDYRGEKGRFVVEKR
jgi:plastocyanin